MNAEGAVPLEGHRRRFLTEPLSEVRAWLAESLAPLAPGGVVACEVPDPDLGQGRYDGERLLIAGVAARHRGIRGWVDLAELLGCRLLTPAPVAAAPGYVRLRFEKLDLQDSFHADRDLPPTERYGPGSRFGRIDKLEEPTFLAALEAAYRRVDLPPGARVLDLGVNTGQELELLRRVYGDARFAGLELVGVDHSPSALMEARARFPEGRFLEHDLNALAALELGRFDLLISVGTLQSAGIRDGRGLLQQVVQEHLTPCAAVILGFPNGRWADGEALYGAWTRNHNHPELSLLWKDVDFAKRYLAQHRFRITLTGKRTVFLTATRIGVRPAGPPAA